MFIFMSTCLEYLEYFGTFLSPDRYWRRQNRGKLSDGWSSSPTRTTTTTPTPHWPPRPTPTTHTTTKGMVDVWVGGDLSGKLSGWARVRNNWLIEWVNCRWVGVIAWSSKNIYVCDWVKAKMVWMVFAYGQVKMWLCLIRQRCECFVFCEWWQQQAPCRFGRWLCIYTMTSVKLLHKTGGEKK